MKLLSCLPLLIGLVSAIFPFGPNESLPAGFCCPLKPVVAKPAAVTPVVTVQTHRREIQELQGNGTHSYGRYELNLLWLYLSDILKNPNVTSLYDVKLGADNGTSIVQSTSFLSEFFLLTSHRNSIRPIASCQLYIV
jgi:hypothetical protein